MAEATERQARVERLLAAARVLADGESTAGRGLRSHLLQTCGLSAPGIELGLSRCLETRAAPEHLAELLRSTPQAPQAHVLLSANVFVAALRAIALGVASSDRVQVRASRREPALAEALHALVPELFELTTALAPVPGERVWAYGSDATLAEVRRSLPKGVWFHAHGSGIGAAVLDAAASTDLEIDARAIALDTALFDQRGCLSPRVVCVVGSAEQAKSLASALASKLEALENELPPGPLGVEELAEARKNRDAAAYAFELFDAGSGWVSLSEKVVVPAPSRCLHVACTPDAVQALAALAPHVTCIATNASAALSAQLGAAFGGARLVALGDMQRPPLDGPVDRRHGPSGELIG
jgi:Acyl-CoA reductase (LuxC)